MNISNIKEKIDIYVNNNLTNIEQRKKFGEVFTPEPLINKMLDLVSSDIWSNPNVKIGDFSVGVGNFTVFIIERFMNGLKDYISNDVDRYNYIIENIYLFFDKTYKNIFIYLNMSRYKIPDIDKKKNITLYINENLLCKVDVLVSENSDKRSRLIERLLLEYIEENEFKLNDNPTPN